MVEKDILRLENHGEAAACVILIPEAPSLTLNEAGAVMSQMPEEDSDFSRFSSLTCRVDTACLPSFPWKIWLIGGHIFGKWGWGM